MMKNAILKTFRKESEGESFSNLSKNETDSIDRENTYFDKDSALHSYPEFDSFDGYLEERIIRTSSTEEREINDDVSATMFPTLAEDNEKISNQILLKRNVVHKKHQISSEESMYPIKQLFVKEPLTVLTPSLEFFHNQTPKYNDLDYLKEMRSSSFENPRNNAPVELSATQESLKIGKFNTKNAEEHIATKNISNKSNGRTKLLEDLIEILTNLIIQNKTYQYNVKDNAIVSSRRKRVAKGDSEKDFRNDSKRSDNEETNLKSSANVAKHSDNLQYVRGRKKRKRERHFQNKGTKFGLEIEMSSSDDDNSEKVSTSIDFRRQIKLLQNPREEKWSKISETPPPSVMDQPKIFILPSSSNGSIQPQLQKNRKEEKVQPLIFVPLSKINKRKILDNEISELSTDYHQSVMPRIVITPSESEHCLAKVNCQESFDPSIESFSFPTVRKIASEDLAFSNLFKAWRKKGKDESLLLKAQPREIPAFKAPIAQTTDNLKWGKTKMKYAAAHKNICYYGHEMCNDIHMYSHVIVNVPEAGGKGLRLYSISGRKENASLRKEALKKYPQPTINKQGIKICYYGHEMCEDLHAPSYIIVEKPDNPAKGITTIHKGNPTAAGTGVSSGNPKKHELKFSQLLSDKSSSSINLAVKYTGDEEKEMGEKNNRFKTEEKNERSKVEVKSNKLRDSASKKSKPYSRRIGWLNPKGWISADGR